MSNKVNIQVYGARYPISTNEDSGYVLDLGKELDQAVHGLMNNGKGLSFNDALVLLSLSYLDSSKKAERSADHLREQIAEYLEEAAKARLELSEARAELERMQRDQQLKMDQA
ncbi:MAG: cell division protein ZapA [Oscillospiraceae bacterium]